MVVVVVLVVVVVTVAAVVTIVMGFYVPRLFGLFVVTYTMYGQIFTHRNGVALSCQNETNTASQVIRIFKCQKQIRLTKMIKVVRNQNKRLWTHLMQFTKQQTKVNSEF
jgi:hypothetical protein